VADAGGSVSHIVVSSSEDRAAGMAEPQRVSAAAEAQKTFADLVERLENLEHEVRT
jgi:hypothetical protein